MNVYSPSTSAAAWIKAFGAGDLLNECAPDLIVVDAPSAGEREPPTIDQHPQPPPIDRLPQPPTIYEFRPTGFRDVLKQVLDLGRLLGRSREAMQYLAGCEKRLTEIRVRAGAPKRTIDNQPRLAYLEYRGFRRTPPNWIDELIDQTGALPLHVDLRSMEVDQASDKLFDFDPDALVIVQDPPREEFVSRFLRHAAGSPHWTSLRAVREDRVYRVDDPARMDDPGPGMYRSVELLCRALYGARSGVALEKDELRQVRIRSQAGA